jgi:hypothetical protein
MMETQDPTGPSPPQAGSEGALVPAPGVSVSASDAAPPAPVPTAVPPRRVIPEDLQTPWTWGDVLVFVFFGFGSAIALTFLMANWAVDLGYVPLRQVQTLEKNPLFNVLVQTVWSLVMLVYLSGMIRFRFGAPLWSTLRFRSFRVGRLSTSGTFLLFLLGGMLLAVAIGIGSQPIAPKERLPIQEMFVTREGALLLMAYGLLVAPLVEEVVFRGYFYPVLARSFGVFLGVVLTGAVFGLIHGQQLGWHWGVTSLLMLVGMVFTLARARTGTVLASYLLHLGYNGLLFIAFFFSTGGFRNFPAQ